MAIDPNALDQALVDALFEPQSATTDAGSVTMPNLVNVEAMLRRIKADEVAKSGKLGIKFSRLRMGGMVN